MDRKVHREDKNFSTRLLSANKETRETFFSMMTIHYNSTEEKLKKLKI